MSKFSTFAAAGALALSSAACSGSFKAAGTKTQNPADVAVSPAPVKKAANQDAQPASAPVIQSKPTRLEECPPLTNITNYCSDAVEIQRLRDALTRNGEGKLVMDACNASVIEGVNRAERATGTLTAQFENEDRSVDRLSMNYTCHENIMDVCAPLACEVQRLEPVHIEATPFSERDIRCLDKSVCPGN